MQLCNYWGSTWCVGEISNLKIVLVYISISFLNLIPFSAYLWVTVLTFMGISTSLWGWRLLFKLNLKIKQERMLHICTSVYLLLLSLPTIHLSINPSIHLSIYLATIIYARVDMKMHNPYVLGASWSTLLS